MTFKTEFDRRNLLKSSSAGLSVLGLLALADASTPASAKGKSAGGDAKQDASLLSAAISLEYEGIAAYELGLGSGLLTADVAGVARLFQSHHKQHNEQLIAAVRRLGATPPEAKTISAYADELEASKLRTAGDILNLALRLERGAASAYMGLIEPLKASELDTIIAKIGADEAMHTGFFIAALKAEIPMQAPLF